MTNRKYSFCLYFRVINQTKRETHKKKIHQLKWNQHDIAWRAPAYDPNAPKPRIIDFYSEDPALTDEEAEQKRKEMSDAVDK